MNAVQKEHILLFDNITVFSDILLQLATGFRQQRLRLIGWKTGDWNGDYYSPGFVFDEAQVAAWTANTDYQIGDTVEYGLNRNNGQVMSSKTYDFTNTWFDSAREVWDHLIPQINPIKILEIGSYEGASACYLIEKLAAQSEIELHCVDTWDGGVEHKAAGAFEANMADVEQVS